ncbi:hypothetical protein PDIG_70240 [Penicillium digitatum PHI26]|uniref:Uncharacterized protein n=2 Tax=Penicillium digitatum TaxID=36651 RepID=K9FZ59_PEND2|nr:hypothetical protein PDIP_79550 [Penicillium digitatum Pd1]EKV06330.1 hypothetical protein PDIP_79550 [Penicillium digitatum Pd1]EKV07948.1 hypothetical protein PDIG_70240 [Penicillium digitatum PHI26]
MYSDHRGTGEVRSPYLFVYHSPGCWRIGN